MTLPPCVWPPCNQPPELDAHAAHLWCISLARSSGEIEQDSRLLSNDESERASRFYFDDIRNRFIAGRSALRSILGKYTGIAPAEIVFRYGAHGKPSLDDRKEFEFNVSNSGDVALVAVTAGEPIGVDVENVRPVSNLWGLMERFFTPKEQDEVRELPDEDRSIAFFHGWTHKESILKATGKGLSTPLDSFVVPMRSVDWQQIETSPTESWWIRSLSPTDGYPAALASQNQLQRVEMFQWTG